MIFDLRFLIGCFKFFNCYNIITAIDFEKDCMESIKQDWTKLIYKLQDDICAALELEDGTAKFKEDIWERAEGGGGRTRVIENGNVFEKGGVNTSAVFGEVTPIMQQQLGIAGHSWFACGLSIVLHPQNPHCPTVHCNYRMFEMYNECGELLDCWFGGGTDLTPYYLVEEDAIHFHKTYKAICDKYEEGRYTKYKKHCDEYFVNKHRDNECRGIGGIFYDYERPTENHGIHDWLAFARDCGSGFLEAYLPIIKRQKDKLFSAEEKYWQEIRRGRYVEFNLVHDRGTLFGLKTNGRTESILMSLPPTVRFDYDYVVEKGSREALLVEVCSRPVNWGNS